MGEEPIGLLENVILWIHANWFLRGNSVWILGNSIKTDTIERGCWILRTTLLLVASEMELASAIPSQSP